jgi:hypothetical protein
MGLRVFDFKCPLGHVTEHFVGAEWREGDAVQCSHLADGALLTCGKPAMRQIATPRFTLDGCSGDFPTAADAWEKRRESHMRKERKNMENHDTYR